MNLTVWAAAALALVFFLILDCGIYGLLRPKRLMSFAQTVVARLGAARVALIRAVIAALLWEAAPVSQAPDVLRVLAVLSLMSAAIVLAIGTKRLTQWVDRIQAWPRWTMQATSLLAVGLSLYLLWAVWPTLRAILSALGL